MVAITKSGDVHYPTDVLVGVLSGIGISYLAEVILNTLFFHTEKEENK